MAFVASLGPNSRPEGGLGCIAASEGCRIERHSLATNTVLALLHRDYNKQISARKDEGEVLDIPAADGRSSSMGRPVGKDAYRRSHQATLVQLIETCLELFPGANINGKKGAKARDLLTEHPPERSVWISEDRLRLLGYISGGLPSPTFCVEINLVRPCSPHKLTILKALVTVFDTDIKSAEWMGRDVEAWESLALTRASRVIARIASFRMGFFIRCLRTMESARELTYEGDAFATRLLLANQISHVADVAGEQYRELKARIPIEAAILNEKWVRPFTSSGTIALVATSRRSTVSGVVIVPDDQSSISGSLHSSIAALERYVTNGVAMIAATQNGDIWLRLANGMVFLRRRSRWQYFDLADFQALLEESVSKPVADALVRLTVDASFERHGALYGIMIDPSGIREASDGSRSNRGLRELVSELDITDATHQPVVRSAAMIDGAILLRPDGRIVDAACIAVEPSQSRREELGVKKWPSVPGARTTAARNLSVFGIAIKVSDDGPISVFANGLLVREIG